MEIQTDDFGNPLCPQCGEPLFHRTGPYGEFFGHRKGTECNYRAKPPKLEDDWNRKQKTSGIKVGVQKQTSFFVPNELGSQMEVLNKAAKETSHYTELQKWADEMKRT